MQRVVQRSGDPIGPLEWFKILPSNPVGSSDRLGWGGLEAARYRAANVIEISPPALTHHRLVLFIRPPEEFDLRYEGVKRHVPPPIGSISLIPAYAPSYWCPSGNRDFLHVYLEPRLIERVALEAFDLDPTRVTIPPLDGLDIPSLRTAMQAVDAEMISGGAGGPLAAEALANLLAVHLIRYVSAPQPERRRDGMLPRGRLRAVIDYIEDRLNTPPNLDEIATVARLSPYHFARQFKTATGMPPHQYIIMRRIERAKQLLQEAYELSLAEVAARVGFSDQSQFSHHFKRLVGVTPGQFRMSARIA